MKKIWITWETQRRNRELSTALDTVFFELAEIDRISNPLRKYLTGIARTVRILREQKPQIVFCQNPSLVLSLLMVLTRKILGFKVCVDAHNAGIFPAEGRSKPLLALARFVQRHADMVIVTNENLRVEVEKNGGRGMVLPDRIPAIDKRPGRDLKGRVNLLFICTYAADEPYGAVFEAARELPEDVVIYVTGNYKKKHIDPKSLPSNIVLTGFVPEEEYLELLNSVDATIDLTTREDCLVCGAYETVSVEKVMVLSDTAALRSYFHKGAVYVDNTPSGISKAVADLPPKLNDLGREVRELRQQLEAEWETMRESLEKEITSWSLRESS